MFMVIVLFLIGNALAINKVFLPGYTHTDADRSTSLLPKFLATESIAKAGSFR